MNLTIHYLIEAPARSGAWGGVSTIIINTFFLILFTLIFSTPIGILGAIYLVEYARQGRMVKILRLGTETLAGIPSIVFGLFGSIFFVNMLGMGIGFISATLSVTMMILPTIVRTTEEALKAVPDSFREGSLALGATKLQTIRRVVLPAATPGILTGIILAVGRTVGETAVLIYTLGSNYELVRGPSSSARVLSLHLYNMFAEAISFDRTFATGAILVFIVLLVNYSTTKLIGRMNAMAGR
jgi:phosphate transport system permease protein